jgi:O-antigen ligase
MIDAAAAPAHAAHAQPSPTRAIPIVLALVTIGYLGASDARIAVAAASGFAVAAGGLLAYRHPRAATITSFALVLVAATKFRLRDATDSLSGILDTQIALELGLYAVVGIAVVAASTAARVTRWRAGPADAMVLAYVAFALASTVWSDAPVLTLVRAVQLSIIAGLALVAVRVMPPSRAIWAASIVLTAYVLVCTASAAVVTPETTFDPDENHARFAWFAVHPIAAGTLAALAALALLSPSLFSRAGTHRVFGLPRLLVLMPLLAILIITRTRGPLLAFAAGAAAMIAMRTSITVRLTVATLAGAALFVYLVTGADVRDWVGAVATTDSQVVQIFFRGQSADRLLTLNGRLDLWRDLGPAIAMHPWLGHGFQASRAFVLETAPWAAYAHNGVVQSLLDVGAIGTILLIAVVCRGLTIAFRSRVSPWLRAALVAFMVFLTFNSITTESFAGSPGFETLLLFMCVLCTQRRATNEDSDRP